MVVCLPSFITRKTSGHRCGSFLLKDFVWEASLLNLLPSEAFHFHRSLVLPNLCVLIPLLALYCSPSCSVCLLRRCHPLCVSISGSWNQWLSQEKPPPNLAGLPPLSTSQSLRCLLNVKFHLWGDQQSLIVASGLLLDVSRLVKDSCRGVWQSSCFSRIEF